MAIALDDVLTILDEHYNKVKALDTLNQELFQLHMAYKETSYWGICLSRHLHVLAASFLNCFPPDGVPELKQDHFYGGLPKRLKVMVAYLKASPHKKTYSDYLRAVREAEKEESLFGDGTDYRPHWCKGHLCGSRKCLYLSPRLSYRLGSSGQSPDSPGHPG